MSEAEKQESQKTVVAFITGLLIGGLLVWVFSSTPEGEKQATVEITGTEQVATEKTTASTEVEEVAVQEVIGAGSIVVADQKAGTVVALGAIKVPTQNGWVVVRDYMDGVPGNILGAARYSVAEGLMPTSVKLIRETTAGSSYQAAFYTNEGTTAFVIGEDKPIDGISTTFKTN